MITVTYNGARIELPEGKEVEALELAARYCGNSLSPEQQAARDLRYAEVMAERRRNG